LANSDQCLVNMVKNIRKNGRMGRGANEGVETGVERIKKKMLSRRRAAENIEGLSRIEMKRTSGNPALFSERDEEKRIEDPSALREKKEIMNEKKFVADKTGLKKKKNV